MEKKRKFKRDIKRIIFILGYITFSSCIYTGSESVYSLIIFEQPTCSALKFNHNCKSGGQENMIS